MRRPYRVILPVEIGGREYQFGDEVELELGEAVEHSAALIALEEGDGNGRDGEGD